MRFLIDANMPRIAAYALRELGHECMDTQVSHLIFDHIWHDRDPIYSCQEYGSKTIAPKQAPKQALTATVIRR